MRPIKTKSIEDKESLLFLKNIMLTTRPASPIKKGISGYQKGVERANSVGENSTIANT
jgi:hypothetical protein